MEMCVCATMSLLICHLHVGKWRVVCVSDGW